MIPQIASALSRGFSSKQVIDFILKKFPEHSDKIKSALSGGFTVDQVLKFLSGNKDQLQTQQRTEPATEFQQTRQRDIGRREEIDKNSLKAGALAATSLAAPMAASALKRALPTTLESTIPNVIGQSLPQMQQQQPSQPLISSELGNISQANEIPQPEVISNPKEYLEKVGVLDVVKDHLKRGTSPEGIAALVSTNMNKKGKLGAKIDPELLKNIEEYAKLPQEEVKTEEIEKPIESPKIEKNSVVSSPNGIGELKELRNGKGLVEVNGKLHKVNEEDLEASPLPEKELSELYDDLISGIEKETGEDVSRMVQWAGYNPTDNSLTFLPHTGKLYKYGNISPEDAALLTDILSTRKTSGSNFIGAWKAGSKSPIGAALSKLIRKLQSERGGKGNEYEETHEPIYSAYEPAINSKKKKKK